MNRLSILQVKAVLQALLRLPLRPRLLRRLLPSLGLAVLVAGCSVPPTTNVSGKAPPTLPAASPSVAPSTTAPPVAAQPALPGTASARSLKLPPPAAVRDWKEVRLQAARRLVAANPDKTYTGVVPEVLLAIPVLEVELHADGAVRRIEVLRFPRQAKDTTQLAIDAVHRAAPFGDVSRLPRPWKFTETFLFDDDRKFKPRTLD